jgi:hypothetical protein
LHAFCRNQILIVSLKNDQNKRGSNGNAAKKSTQKPTNQWGNPNGYTRITSASIVAGLTGFALLGLLVVFFWWMQELLEKFHLGRSAVVCCFLTFAVAVIGIAWLLVEIWPRLKFMIIAGTIVSCIGFAAFLYLEKEAFVSTGSAALPITDPATANRGGRDDQVEPAQSKEYEPLSHDECDRVIDLLHKNNQKFVISVHTSDPDNSAYLFAEQLSDVFLKGGHVTFRGGELPKGIEEKPNMSVFPFGFIPDLNLMMALDIILNHSGSLRVQEIGPMAHDVPWPKTNAVLLIIIRRK